ncbi:DUF4044 domain-containing protein [Vagococcus salmoninarum]|uniref:DUF4044 domain-containing protein n=1 Tax=Vagococcus salmoninarum TaxID=2739 RepID=A0A429ZLL5_9ENTE|nr:DUF4044 domain-containing protein [Vagococcus salmoninarum]MBE9388791.1 DUF4044 domain-containing protein [Vagococcus salmoninarum]RST94548.1 DUF4044 domain-containing protein [Vagococcus salmoninarum]
MGNKKTSTFSKITKVVVWLMIIAIVGGTVIGSIAILF